MLCYHLVRNLISTRRVFGSMPELWSFAKEIPPLFGEKRRRDWRTRVLRSQGPGALMELPSNCFKCPANAPEPAAVLGALLGGLEEVQEG